MKGTALACLLIGICIFFSGCGETISGVGKDTNRMGKGVNTFFFRQQ